MSPDGTTAFATDQTGDVVVWDLSGGRRLGRAFTAGSGATGPAGGWPFFATSPDGRTIAVISFPSDGNRGTIALIDTSDLRVVKRIRYPESMPMAWRQSDSRRSRSARSPRTTRHDQSYVRSGIDWEADDTHLGYPDCVAVVDRVVPTDARRRWRTGVSDEGREPRRGQRARYCGSTAAPGQGSFETPLAPVAGPSAHAGRLAAHRSNGLRRWRLLSWDTKARAIVRPPLGRWGYGADISNDAGRW
jgi:hypothetical protein